ncbi:uncharacterized protein BP5553_00243 [Venustampulla echinocandica]|uniref:Uncharacterized protein n=1 Tax=Venustampulla echinocandica TaxID=2656787 RepID=A0A370TXJ7_9HELO|nr:uncharacterized protein BP5553_00243 [Venustampulla echinocandica]RDL40264.1 hypothetical protein BP5553_00243 [Venustampulla echinocandica]
MSSTQEQIPPRRKRQRAEADLSLDDQSESQLPKRLKSSIKLHSAEFYDSLSKVWLTRRALKELDRRTSQANSPQQRASTLRPITRNTSDKIQRFARDGGPELCDLRGYPSPRSMGSSNSLESWQTKSTAQTSIGTLKTTRSSAYDSDFEQHLRDHHIHLNNRRSKPGNLGELRQRLLQPRPILSPSPFSDDAYEDFELKHEDITEEGEIMQHIVPIICGNSNIPNKQNLLFTRLYPIANGTTVAGKPDFYDGARLDDINKQVQKDLGHFIIPTRHPAAPVAPNFFLEVKAPRGAANVARRQAGYNGALGARAMHLLQSYKQDQSVYDGDAYTITSTYHAGTGTLQIYITHATKLDDGNTEYHMTQVDSWGLTGSPDSFRRGVTALCNARDWAQEQRDRLILDANERVRSMNAEAAPSESSRRRSHRTASVASGNYNRPSEMVDGYHTEEAETLSNELGADTSLKPKTSSNVAKVSDKSVSKAARHSGDESRQRRFSQR